MPHVGVQRVACPDPYRSAYSGTAEEVAHACAEDIRSVIRHSTPGKVAGFIAEPIQGVGGAVAYGGNYFGEAYKIVREHGGLCIADEVQTGFGRTGERYWGFENYDVVPDIVTMAKGLGNGAPIAAVSTTREIAETLAQRIHINTFGGNPVSMAQGLATLDVIDEEDLQNNAHEMGQLLQSGLLELMEKYPLIGEVRGIGLMLGVELVRDRSTKEPASAETAEFLELCRENQLLLGKGGLFGNVLRIKPPLCITCADVEYALHVMDQSFAALSCGAGRST